MEYDIFSKSPRLFARTFSRKGGVSEGPFTALNINHGQDDPQCVDANVKIMLESLPDSVSLIEAKQTHGDICQEVTDKNKPLICDALMTDEPYVALLIKHADCQAAIMYDPIKHALALVHSGWRGSGQNIYAKTVKALVNRYNTDPKDLLVAISPSLGPCHCEFINYKTELPESFTHYQVKPFYFDFWKISNDQLSSAGVLPDHIQLPTTCTYDDAANYFSYRRDKITGRNGTLAYLKTL